MGAAVNGMALHGGIIPYGATFLIFHDYMRPAVRLSALSHLGAIWVYTHDSVGLGEDGPTHQPVEHYAALRAIPNLLFIRPCDANETVWAWRVAIANRHRPTAIALSRQNVPTLDRSRFAPADGLQRGAYVLNPGVTDPEIEHVGAALEAVGGGEAAAVERRDVLAAQRNRRRAVAIGDRDAPGPDRLVGVARTDEEEVRDRAQRRVVLDRLVRRPVLAEAHAVVRVDPDGAEVGERREADGGAHVVMKDEERGSVGDDAAVEGHAVDRRAHGVLAHAEVEVAAGVAPRRADGALDARGRRGRALEVTLALEPGERRGVEVRRSAHQLGEPAAELLEHRLGGFARGKALRVGGEGRQLRVPALGQASRHHAAELGRFGWKRARAGGERGFPFALPGAPAVDGAAEVRERVRGDQEGWLDRPAEPLLRRPQLFGAERGAVRLEGILLMRCPVAQVRAHHDERRAVTHRGGRPQRLLEGREVVAVLDAGDVPAVGFEAAAHVLGERERGGAGERDPVVVVEDVELAEPEVAGERARLRRHALHEVAVAREHPGVVVDDDVARAVEARGEVRLGDGKAHRIADALTERPRGGLDARGEVHLGMPGRAAAPLAKAADLVERQVAREVEQGVEEHRAVAGREDEAVA